MKKRLALLSLIVIIIMAIFIRRYYFTIGEDKALKEKVETSLIEEDSFDFSKFEEDKWDRIIPLRPYSILGQVEKDLDLKTGEIRDKRIEMYDTGYLIILANKDEVYKYFYLDRVIGDFSDLVNKTYKKDQGLLKKKIEDGQVKLLFESK